MKKLIAAIRRCIMKNRQREGSLMKIEISTADAAQVKAILMTHAEMQDQRLLEGEGVIGRLQVDEPDSDLLVDMREDADDLSLDTENLKRIANLF